MPTKTSKRIESEIAHLETLARKFTLKYDVTRGTYESALSSLLYLHNQPDAITLSFSYDPLGEVLSILSFRKKVGRRMEYGITKILKGDHTLLLNNSPRQKEKLAMLASIYNSEAALESLLKLRSMPEDVDMHYDKGFLATREKAGKKRIMYGIHRSAEEITQPNSPVCPNKQTKAEIARLEKCIREELGKLELWGKGGNWVLTVKWRTFKAYSSELLLPCLDIVALFRKRDALIFPGQQDDEKLEGRRGVVLSPKKDFDVKVYKRVQTFMGEYKLIALEKEGEWFPHKLSGMARENTQRRMAEQEKEEWQKLKDAKKKVVERDESVGLEIF